MSYGVPEEASERVFSQASKGRDFSTLHDEWLRSLLAIRKADETDPDEDALDTLFLLVA